MLFYSCNLACFFSRSASQITELYVVHSNPGKFMSSCDRIADWPEPEEGDNKSLFMQVVLGVGTLKEFARGFSRKNFWSGVMSF